MMQILKLFLEDEYHITFASTAAISEKSETLEYHFIQTVSIQLNDSSFDDFILKLNPSIVLFDRYITEEQFGWRISEQCSNALKILDTEDLHFLRKAREKAYKEGDDINLFSETAKREVASIYRCDVTLIISEFEMELLQNQFKIDENILFYLPFLEEPITEEKIITFPTFEERSGFMTIGNLLHGPNIDSVKYLKKEIWPLIKQQMPNAILTIYGNYASQQIQEFHNEKEGFLIKGWTDNLEEVMTSSKICLAPLRFGAGLKGKLLDAMKFGTPSVTTKVGAEGMQGDNPYPGIVADSADQIANAAVQLYASEEKWNEAQSLGFQIIIQRFQKSNFKNLFLKKISDLKNNLLLHRNSNFTGQILQHHSLKSTQYMSKWIEEKNKKS
ncbi:MAG: glycosyltransferase family 4 protein [Flavobacteriaceae bacterium]|nr:glycosyltransferase family 4 protein [Flavobacteriaceae bacterium]